MPADLAGGLQPLAIVLSTIVKSGRLFGFVRGKLLENTGAFRQWHWNCWLRGGAVSP